MSSQLPVSFDFHPLVGWKMFRERDGYLFTGTTVLWTPGRPYTAQCTAGRGHKDPPPAPGCSCGVYSYKTLRDLVHYTENGYMYGGTHLVLGQLWLWGIVIQHQLGYRAEYAYPKQLGVADEATAVRIQALYAIPCEVIDVRATYDTLLRSKV